MWLGLTLLSQGVLYKHLVDALSMGPIWLSVRQVAPSEAESSFQRGMQSTSSPEHGLWIELAACRINYGLIPLYNPW